METVKIEISAAPEHSIQLLDFPELASENKLVGKGIAILRQYTPSVLRYLSMQHLLGRLPTYHVEVRAGNMPEAEVRALLGTWMQRKRTRRLFYVVLELLLLPFTAFVALLPGPNVVFYGLFVLFYFHFKAFLSLSRIKVEELQISLIKN